MRAASGTRRRPPAPVSRLPDSPDLLPLWDLAATDPWLPGCDPGEAVDAPTALLEGLFATTGYCETAAQLAALGARQGGSRLRKAHGSFDTPPVLIHQVLDQALSHLRWPVHRPCRILEPAAGYGGFAVALQDRLGLQQEALLHCCELNPAAAELAQRLLLRQRRDLGLTGVKGRWTVGDALLSTDIEPGTYDLVMGNPPFVATYARDAQALASKATLRERYRFAQGRINTAVCFLELGIAALRPGGLLALILPSALFHMTSWDKLRHWLLTEHEVLEIRYCGEWAFHADVPTGVLILRKGATADAPSLPGLPQPATVTICRDHPPHAATVPQSTFLHLPQQIWTPYVDPASRALLEAMERDAVPLGELVEIRDGINLANCREQLLSESPLTSAHRPVLRGGDIAPWQIRWGGSYVWYDPAAVAALEESGGYAFLREPWLFAVPEKLVHRQTADRLIAAPDRSQFCVLNSCHLTIPRPLLPDPQRSGARLLKDHTWAPLTDLRFLCALYNSRLLNTYYRLVFCEVEATFPQVKTVNLRQLPMPRLAPDILGQVVALADQIQQAPLPEQAAGAMDTIDRHLADHYQIAWPFTAPHLAALSAC